MVRHAIVIQLKPFAAPKAQDKKAQGNALGNGTTKRTKP
jgi:hypothetical protein